MTDHIRVTWTVVEGGAKTDVVIHGDGGPLPEVWLPFWRGNPADVRDLEARGYPGEGYWPYSQVKDSIADAETEALSVPSRTIDVEAMTVTDTWAKIDLPLTAGTKAAAKRQIDSEAEAVRLQFITPGVGQAMTYQQKRIEAERFIATAGEGDYPLLDASVGIEGETRAAVASIVLTTLAMWTAVAAAIERMCLGAKKAIDEAETWTELRAARSVDWMEGLPS